MASITSIFNTDTFKTQLTGGGARPNQFLVSLTFPSFVTDRVSSAVSAAPFLVNAASLPGQSIGKTGTMYRGREIKLAGDRDFAPWRIRVLNDHEMIIRNCLERWMNGINGLRDNSGYLSPFSYQTDLTVVHLDRNNNPLRSYTLYDAMPIELGEIGLDFGNNNTVEEYDVTFEIQHFEADAFNGISGQARTA